MTTADPLTIGVLTEPFLYEWQVRALERVQANPAFELSLVVRNASNDEYEAESWNTATGIGPKEVQEFLEVFRTEKAWTFVLAGRTIARLLGDEFQLWHRHSLENVDVLSGVDQINCDPIADDNWNELPADVVSTVADRCDVVVRFGFGLIKGDILTAPEHGVVSFHPADIRRYRGMGPPVIFHDGRTRAGSTLQRLTDSIDAGEIVAYEEVSIADCYTLWDVFDRLAILQIKLLSTGLTTLQDPTVEPDTVPQAELGPFYARAQRRRLSFAGRVLGKNTLGFIRNRLEGNTQSTDYDLPSEPDQTIVLESDD